MTALANSAVNLDAAGKRAMRLAALASVSVAATLIIAKAISWYLSDSMAMFGSLMDSGLDLVASLATLFAISHAVTPADEDHRFGHGKAEALAALFQAAIITGSALFLVLGALGRLMSPVAVHAAPLSIGVSLLAILLTFALVGYQRYVVRKTGSMAVNADSLHYAGDLFLNLAVIVAVVGNAFFGITILDPIFALGIGAFLGWNAFKLARAAIDMLMDKEWPEEERQKIIGLILENKSVMDVHELRTRTSGTDGFIQFHIGLAPDMTVSEAHMISDEIEARLGEIYPHAEILIHIDPINIVEHDQRQSY